MRYVTRGFWAGDDRDVSITADTIEEADKLPQFTGLYDASGQKLYRTQETVEFGFVARKPRIAVKAISRRI